MQGMSDIKEEKLEEAHCDMNSLYSSVSPPTIYQNLRTLHIALYEKISMSLPRLFFDPLSSFQQKEELEYRDTLAEYMEDIIPQIRPFGEDLREDGFYLNKAWLEITDDEDKTDVVIHFFREGREHMRSVNGNISRGSWELMEDDSNYFILDYSRQQELYTLAFLNNDFFILKKHGNQSGFNKKKYLVLGREGAMYNRETGGFYTWREYAEALSQVYQQDNRLLMFMVIGIVVLVFLVVWFI
jgi:hypothetical protein